MAIRRQAVFVFVLIFGVLSAQAAGQHPIGSELRGFEHALMNRPFHIESDALNVTLRPIGARTHVRMERADGMELFVARDRAAVESVAYEIAGSEGVIAAVHERGGIRFVTGIEANDRMVSAPLVVDAVGRPSTAARWELTASDREGHRTMHLVIDDSMLKYPLTIAYRPGAAERPLVSAVRPSNPVVNSTGSIAGRLTDSVTNQPIANEFVFVYDATGEFATYGMSDGNGNYVTVDGLGTGRYYAIASVPDYVGELYNNIDCSAGCNPVDGTAITVTDDIVTSNINFALTPYSGRITGQITSGATALEGVPVLFYDHNNDPVVSAYSNSDGVYETAVAAAASPYKARTTNYLYPGLIDQLYNGIPCVGCDVSTGTAINVSPGITTSGINFNLTGGGQISGSVVETGGTPIYLAEINVYNSSGLPVANAFTDPAGNFTISNGLSAGNYYVLASEFQHSPKLYNNIPCNRCAVTSGTPVAVTAGQTTSNINFTLVPRSVQVSGRVFDATTNAGVNNVLVLFYDTTGIQTALGVTDGNGNYTATVEEGTYYARTDNGANSGYLEQLYNNIDCSGCNPTTGTTITAVGGQSVTGINFGLRSNGGRISGRVTSAENGGAAAVPFGSVAIYNSTGQYVTYGIADSNGDYTSFDGLTAGTYYATAWAEGYGTQLYSGISCVNGCDVRTGTHITVTAGQTTSNINFALTLPIARISGRVAAASNNAAISGATVLIFDGLGQVVASVQSDASGNYTASLSADGTYYAVGTAVGYADQLFDGHSCNGCDPTTGDGIIALVGATVSNVNFLLQQTNCAGMSLEPSSLPNGRVAVGYSTQLSTIGAVAPVTYAVIAGDLPDGVTLNGSTGLISGTPTSAGTFPFTIAATGSNGCSAGRNYVIEIDPTDTVTTTTLTVSPNPSTYGDTVTLTATVTGEGATGTVTFKDNGFPIGSASLNASGVAVLLVSNFTAGTHPLKAAYGGAPTYLPSESTTVNATVDKFAPNINWSTPADIVYGTPLTGTQLNATASGVNGVALSGSFVYAPAAGTVLSAGSSQTLTVHFAPTDSVNYSSATSTVQINVLKADPVISWTPGSYTFGDPLGAAQLNATATGVTGAALAGSFVYNPPAGTVLTAGQQTLSTHFTPTDTANYNEADKTVTLNASKADPVFSNLSAPSIIIGTASTTISGKLSLGSLYPSGSVSITLNGVTQSAAISAANGTFSSSFATGSLVPPSYTISFSYAGDTNFNAASATSTLSVHYGATGTKVSNGVGNGTVPFRVTVTNAAGANIGSSSLSVTAYGVRLVSNSTWLPAQSSGNQGPLFQLQSNGTYMFTLKTTGLAAGDYVFGYTVGADTTVYTITFTVK